MDKIFPFNYIPDNIDPFLKKTLIILICVQFFSFLFFIVYLSVQHISIRKNNRNNQNTAESTANTNSPTNQESPKKSKKKKE